MAVFAVGQRFKRLEPQGDAFDLVEVCGHAQGGTAGEIVEPVIRTVDFCDQGPAAVDPEAFIAEYTREGVSAAELTPPWQTDLPAEGGD